MSDCGEPQFDRERDELLLRAVVNVALELAALLVLRGHEALLRALQILEPRTKVLGQADVPQDEAGLRGEVGDELRLRLVHRVVGRHRDGERPEELAPVLDREGGVRLGKHGERAIAIERNRAGTVASNGQDAATRSRSCVRSQTSARAAPIPSPTTRAILGRTSSSAYVSATRSENSARSSYGVARVP